MGVEKGNKVLLIALNYSMKDLTWKKIYQEPFLLGYYQVVEPLARFSVDILKKLIRDEDVEEQIAEFKRKYPISDLAQMIVDILKEYLPELKDFGGDKAVAFIYDVKKDEYVLKAEEVIS